VADAKSLQQPDRTASDIARQLRDEFSRALKDATGADAAPDVTLRVLFHSVAAQVDWIYREADQVFFAAALDDLIRGLGMPGRLARPAQAVVQFSQLEHREAISSEIELIGFQPNGAQLVFVPDTTLDIAPADLVFAAVAEGGRLTTLPGARLPWVGQAILPGGSTPVDLSRAAPTIFLAFESDSEHLSRLGIFLETTTSTSSLPITVGRSPWQLLDGQGRVVERGVLRSAPARGGMRRLSFVSDPARPLGDSGEIAGVVPLVGGAFGGSVWVFPEIGADRRWRCRMPPSIADAIPKLLPTGHERALDRPLIWLQIPLPAGTRDVGSQIARFAINCVTASNIEVFNDQVDFVRMGTVVSHRPRGAADRHLMGVLSVVGESGGRYLEVADLDAPPGSGRYRLRDSARFELAPAKQATGRFDSYAMIRLLYCDGADGNGIAAGEIKQIRTELPKNPTARVTSLTPTRGGAAPPDYADARIRFAELLRTRERVVTAGDIEVAARTVEDRIRGVVVDSVSEITSAGLGLVTRVTATVSPDEFADPDAELERLRLELEAYLSERCMIGQRIQVAIAREGGR
jgi:hypothetical protein